ncbi:hypothetical protein [Chryseobacterium sp. JV558]|uniref:hypothetical protein n=1 Tax=Chryseobacterium sp. JV558 TaxID=2663236 RepID=UPI00299E4FB0|nr:hypothetical protein [Chryseobacterium sp. JV558]MDW9382765.1 hypothetical protein [Chryseobacterium sp. JV558]
MAIAKKGLRKIVVKNETFYWKIRKKISHNEQHNSDYRIPILHESEGQILFIIVNFCRSEYYGREAMAITPALIQSKIIEAINLGWAYSHPGIPISLINGELAYL